MAQCPFCGRETDRFIMFHGTVVGCRYCGVQKKETNADRIRAMSDEELEKWFWWMHDVMFNFTDSRAFLHEWLNSEVDDDTQH